LTNKYKNAIIFTDGNYHKYTQETEENELQDINQDLLKWLSKQKRKYYEYKYNEGICVYNRDEIQYIRLQVKESE